MSTKRTLIINIPVIHKGFLDFLGKNKKIVDDIYILDKKTILEFSDIKPDIASLENKTVVNLLKSFGLKKVSVFTKKYISKIKTCKVMMINDSVSRGFADEYLSGTDIKWANVFLRWDAKSVLADKPVNGRRSDSDFDKDMMREAYTEAGKSGDWWRRVGAVLVKDKNIIFRAYNTALPNDHTPYQVGNIRDFIKAGEKQELSSTIHSEQKIIAEAAKKGVSLEGTKLYITHFPCPVCTKLIIFSGIKECFFVEGASNLDGEKLLGLANIKISAIKL